MRTQVTVDRGLPCVAILSVKKKSLSGIQHDCNEPLIAWHAVIAIRNFCIGKLRMFETQVKVVLPHLASRRLLLRCPALLDLPDSNESANERDYYGSAGGNAADHLA